MNRRFILGACLAVLACGRDATEPGVRLGDDFTLAIGQAVRIEGTGVTVELRDVPDDSRCPPEALCFWVGNVGLELRVTGVADCGTVSLCSELCPRAASLGPYELRMISVSPGYPPSSPDAYRATLRMTLRCGLGGGRALASC
jgi:hypothetical protein